MAFRFFFLSLCVALSGVSLRADYVPVPVKVPEPPREFRAAWIATVHNLDWPSKPGLSPTQQRAEMIALLDLAAATGLNAVIFQVRTECDAFYPSNLEPWSFFLSGNQGTGPADGYDPLAFAIAEAHKRGIELHAWFNPFRASATERSNKSSKHITRTHSSQMLGAGTMKWGNPASEFVRQRAIDVMVDVTRRYDIDGVHIDDYFYPYPKSSGGKTYDQFDDSSSYRSYKAKGGKLELRDWRRDNINHFVRTAYGAVKSAKSHVEFGISPFGIWRPGSPSSVKADRLGPELHLALPVVVGGKQAAPPPLSRHCLEPDPQFRRPRAPRHGDDPADRRDPPEALPFRSRPPSLEHRGPQERPRRSPGQTAPGLYPGRDSTRFALAWIGIPRPGLRRAFADQGRTPPHLQT
jgi:uncharacterized lipoprotein YddW (UPF0748 family)